MSARAFLLVLVLAAPALNGCAIPAILADSFGAKIVPKVDESADAFNQDLRWGRVQQAVAQVAPAQRERFLALFDGDESAFRFTSVEVISATPQGVGGRDVDVLVAWEFYSPPGLTERKLRQKQVWRFLELERRWEVEPDLAGFEAAVAPRGAPVPASPQR